MIVNARKLLEDARKGGYAVGAFNAHSIATAEAIISTAEELHVPVIVQIGDYLDPNAQESRKMTFFQNTTFMTFLKNRAEQSPMPICIHLDHCKSYDGCIRAIQFGASSVMIDGSMLSLDDNIALTKRVVEATRPFDITVEAEIGHVGNNGGNDNEMYTTVEEAVKFYNETHVDMLAVAVGTAHGVYATTPVLQYDRITEIKNAIPAPLVLHGASGLVPEQYAEVVKRGITKINFATYMQLAGAKAIKEKVKEVGDNKIFFDALMKVGMEGERQIIREHIGYFLTKRVDE